MVANLITILLLGISPTARANLRVPLGFDSAKLLPQGVRTIRYNHLAAAANEKFNHLGQTTGVGHRLKVKVDWRRFIDGLDTASERGIVQGLLAKEGRPLEQLAGRTDGELSVALDARVGVFGWGLTPRWSLALAVPIIKVRSRLATGFVPKASLQEVADKLVAQGLAFKARELRDKTRDPIARKAAQYNYKSLRRPDGSALGDIRLINKFKVGSGLALLGELTLPTGRPRDPHYLVDVPTGDGQVDVAVGLVGQRSPWRGWNFWGQLKYTWQAPDRVDRRVPLDGVSTLSPDLEHNIDRDLGDILYASVGASLELWTGGQLRLQGAFQRRARDRYHGRLHPQQRYDWLALESDQRLTSLQLGLGYSTIPLFRRQRFPLPLELNVNTGWPLAGRNAIKDPLTVAEVAAYF